MSDDDGPDPELSGTKQHVLPPVQVMYDQDFATDPALMAMLEKPAKPLKERAQEKAPAQRGRISRSTLGLAAAMAA